VDFSALNAIWEVWADDPTFNGTIIIEDDYGPVEDWYRYANWSGVTIVIPENMTLVLPDEIKYTMDQATITGEGTLEVGDYSILMDINNGLVDSTLSIKAGKSATLQFLALKYQVGQPESQEWDPDDRMGENNKPDLLLDAGSELVFHSAGDMPNDDEVHPRLLLEITGDATMRNDGAAAGVSENLNKNKVVVELTMKSGSLTLDTSNVAGQPRSDIVLEEGTELCIGSANMTSSQIAALRNLLKPSGDTRARIAVSGAGAIKVWTGSAYVSLADYDAL
jgi:hypothetical protein